MVRDFKNPVHSVLHPDRFPAKPPVRFSGRLFFFSPSSHQTGLAVPVRGDHFPAWKTGSPRHPRPTKINLRPDRPRAIKPSRSLPGFHLRRSPRWPPDPLPPRYPPPPYPRHPPKPKVRPREIPPRPTLPMARSVALPPPPPPRFPPCAIPASVGCGLPTSYPASAP
ncbi:MAG: hypothetical protein JWL81_250 [Verrucomicrobiales bacterium]|nr:hypothetical protein [Verrucomicrobiales bacterium]